MNQLKLFLALIFFCNLSITAQCNGSANCSVCTNCSRCRYCKGGGACGVCSPGSFKTKNNVIKKSSQKPANDNTKPKEQEISYDNSNNPNEITVRANEESGQKEIFTIVEEQAEFPGGIGEMSKFITANLTYPYSAREAGISGKCFLKFIVNEDGKISDIEVLKGVTGCKECDIEAIRMVKSMPNWKPAKMGGKYVSCYFNLPLTFRAI